MINRRIPAVDGKGMGEWLDERGPDGQGIRVTSTYIVRLSNGGATNQRVIQNKLDNPAQVFYNFELTQVSSQRASSSNYTSALWAAGVRDTLKLVTIPVAKNHVLLRFENLQDPVDGDTSSKVVQLDDVIQAILKWNNPTSYASLTYTTVEKSLTANMDLSDLIARRINWRTINDATGNDEDTKGHISYEFNGSTLSLESQRIRVIEVKVNLGSDDETMFLQ